ncbi:PREDICTED: testis- and ovary-specific PAZ domain-containing protein 1 [Sturnus vulgaris]|uniref:testis- and ovary-specific PAZ domain-containing protein 1 n=1 Tax=Sturnus vulgaris TaxID=9172 RepID=UPI00071AA2BC|nr:PREDICTED: testis- and ovary-specific PAZ domain-containing protein 1 [Sturnus vulgaris]
MAQLRSGKVLRASEVKLVDSELSSPSSSGTGCEPGEKLLVKRSPRLALKRKLGQPLPSFPQRASLSGASFKCFVLPMPVQKEQGENRQKFPGKKNKGIQRRKSPSRSKDVASAVSDTAECEDWQAASMAAAMCWEETLRGTVQSQQLFFSGTTLPSKFSAGIERNECCSEDLNFLGFHMGSRNSENEGKHSCMEIKFEVPSLEGEIESTERHGISCFPEPGGLQPKKITWNTEVKCTGSIMTQNIQIPDFRKEVLGTQEAIPEPKPQQKDDTPERLNGCELVGSRTLETQKREWRCLGKEGRRSVVKPKVHGPKERDGSALLEQHTQCLESRKGALNMRNRSALLSQQLQDLSGQEQPTTRRKKRCMKVEQQSSSSQEGPDSPGESAEEQLKAIEQDSGTSQTVKKVRTKQNRAEDSKEKESHYCRSFAVSTAGDSDSKSFLCHAVTKKPAVQCRKRQRRSGQIKQLQSLSVTAAEKVMNTSAKCDAEHCSNALNHCSGLLCATVKDPFVILEDCSYINTLVKPSASGTTNSYQLNGFFHVAHGTGDLNDIICSTSRRQNETSLIKGGLSSNKEKNEDGCVSCCLSESSKCLRGKKWNTDRKPRKRMKTTEESADVASKCKKDELQTEAAVAMSSSFAVSGLNHILSASHTSDFDAEKNTHEVQTLSAWRNNNTKLLALETGFKKTSELSVVKGENSSSVAYCAAASDSLRVLAQIHDVSDFPKSKTGGNLNKVNKKLKQFTCQRTIPMTGKKVWPIESCARTSEWFLKNHRSVSEGGRLLKAAFEDSSDKTNKVVGHSAVPGNLRQLDLHTSLAEITKEITHKKIDSNIDCQASLETMESSSVGIYETLTMNSENEKSPVNTDRSAMTFNHGDVQEVKATLNFTAKQKDENEGDVTKRNLPATVQNGTTEQKDKNEGGVTNRNLPATVHNGTSTSNTNSINFSHKVSVVNQTFSDLNLIKPLTSGSLTKFKIPLCINKPESKKRESVYSFESKTCSPLELLESTSPGRQKTGEETFLLKSEQHPLPVMGVATSPASIQKKTDEIDSKDFQHSGSVNLSDEISVLSESFSAYPHPLLDGQPEPSVPDFYSTECVLKSSFPDHSWNAVDRFVELEINGDRKSRGNFSQHESQNLPDILEAYNQDVLVIDVIQDDPDLFGASNEEELVPAHCENTPVKASSAKCIEDTKVYIKPESPVTSEKTYSVERSFRCMRESGMSSDTENSCNLMLKAEDVKTHNSFRGSSPSRDVSEDFLKDKQQSKLDELLTSLDVDEKFKLADGVPDVEEENKREAEKRDSKCKVNCEMLSGLPLNDREVNLFSGSTEMKSWTNGYKSSGRSTLLPVKNCGDFEPWTMEKNAIAYHSVQQILDALNLPRKYCRYYFMTSRGCERTKCWFCHVPGQGDEKICMAILRTYINISEPGLLKRAVQIFVQYYKEVIPGVDFASEVLNDLLVSLLSNCMLQQVFRILNVIVQIKTLPAVDVLLKVFEHVASLNIRSAVPTLMSTFCKLIDAGIFLELEHFDYIIKLLHQLQVSGWEMRTVLNIKSRFKERYFAKTWIFDFNLAVAEIQHCKEKRDWTKLGALYLNARTGCEHFDDVQKLCLSIAEILTKASETDKPGVPFCDFADAVMKNSRHNKGDRLFVGRTGISVMYSYHKVLQWIKGSKVLDKLHELRIHFTLFKGLIGPGRSASRCQIVNKATEIFLHSGNLDGAIRVLRESEWITDAPLWPCDKMDILNRHNLLCAIVHKYLRKSLYRQAFEVLQNLPGLQKHSDIIDASQYSHLFNKLVNACYENKNLGVSSSAVDFMLSRKIAIDFVLLRGLIKALGRSSLWSKARTYYKNALSLGCYPELQGNLYHKLLKIPSYLSEVEMLLTIEIFLVSNASDIQSPRTGQALQIILKRSEDAVHNNSAYHGAVERLIQAAHLSDPKLFLKHMTMNVNMEEVYSLEHSSALKWLQENMEWAEKVWLFQ